MPVPHPVRLEAPYPCSSANFQQMTGELLLSTANATNLQSLSANSTDTFTLNAVVQPASAEYAALSNPITFYDGGTAVGTAALGGNGTLATLSLSNVSPGTHTYTARYPADSNYSSFSFGKVTVNVGGSVVTPPVTTGRDLHGGRNAFLPPDRRRRQRNHHARNHSRLGLHWAGQRHLLQPRRIHHLQCHHTCGYLRLFPQHGNRHRLCGRRLSGCCRS